MAVLVVPVITGYRFGRPKKILAIKFMILISPLLLTFFVINGK